MTVPDRTSQPLRTPTATAKVKMLWTSYPDSGSEDPQMVDHEEPGRALANLVSKMLHRLRQRKKKYQGTKVVQLTREANNPLAWFQILQT